MDGPTLVGLVGNSEVVRYVCQSGHVVDFSGAPGVDMLRVGQVSR